MQRCARFAAEVAGWGRLSRTCSRWYGGGLLLILATYFGGSRWLGLSEVASCDPNLHAAQKTIVAEHSILDLIGNQRLGQDQVRVILFICDVRRTAGKSKSECCFIQLQLASILQQECSFRPAVPVGHNHVKASTGKPFNRGKDVGTAFDFKLKFAQSLNHPLRRFLIRGEQ